MLYALRHPVALLALLAGFLVGVVAHGAAQAFLAGRLGEPFIGGAGRRGLDPRRHLDPFGAIAAGLAGPGWGGTPDLDRLRLRTPRRYAVAVLAGPVANLLLAAAGIGGYLLAGGPSFVLDGQVVAPAVRGSVLAGSSPQTVLLLFGIENLAMALLSLVPLPPLDGARVLFALGPRSPGWQRAQYVLSDQNWGILAVLLLLVVPLAGTLPPLLFVIDQIGSLLLHLAGGD
ncbi:MAG: hypothetical protein ACR2JO_00750 [Mycobacteriales bacterium]